MKKCVSCSDLNENSATECKACGCDLSNSDVIEISQDLAKRQPAGSSIRKLLGPIILAIGIAIPCIGLYCYLFDPHSHVTGGDFGKSLITSALFIITGLAWMKGNVAK